MKVHPELGSQESSVQGSRSSQVRGVPGVQPPSTQASPAVQALPSSHESVLLVYTHPELGSHESSVQALLSLQIIGRWPQPTRGLQTSLVQALLSSHVSVNTQPDAGSQESAVQAFWSSQVIGVW